MSCCDGSGVGGARPRWSDGGCNCGGGQSGGRCEPEARSFKSAVQRDKTPGRPTGGCGRPNCPRIVYPPPETPEVEWEYTNYNRKNHQWVPKSNENVYPEYGDDFTDQEPRTVENYRFNESDDEFAVEEIHHDYCDNCDRVENNIYESYARVGGGCENPWTSEETYLDYYDEEECVDHRDPNGTPVTTSCPRCCEKRSSSKAESDSCGRKRVHF